MGRSSPSTTPLSPRCEGRGLEGEGGEGVQWDGVGDWGGWVWSVQSVEEYNQAVCLCGDKLCKGSYLSLGGPTVLQQMKTTEDRGAGKHVSKHART